MKVSSVEVTEEEVKRKNSELFNRHQKYQNWREEYQQKMNLLSLVEMYEQTRRLERFDAEHPYIMEMQT
jgi:hypothetical protein